MKKFFYSVFMAVLVVCTMFFGCGCAGPSYFVQRETLVSYSEPATSMYWQQPYYYDTNYTRNWSVGGYWSNGGRERGSGGDYSHREADRSYGSYHAPNYNGSVPVQQQPYHQVPSSGGYGSSGGHGGGRSSGNGGHGGRTPRSN